MLRKVVRILYVDPDVDERLSGQLLERCTTHLNFVCVFNVVSNAFVALESTQYLCYDAIIVKDDLPHFGAVALFRILKTVGANVNGIVLHNREKEMDRTLDESLGIRHFLPKPFSSFELGNAIITAMGKERLQSISMKNRSTFPNPMLMMNQFAQFGMVPSMFSHFQQQLSPRIEPPILQHQQHQHHSLMVQEKVSSGYVGQGHVGSTESIHRANASYYSAEPGRDSMLGKRHQQTAEAEMMMTQRNLFAPNSVHFAESQPNSKRMKMTTTAHYVPPPPIVNPNVGMMMAMDELPNAYDSLDEEIVISPVLSTTISTSTSTLSTKQQQMLLSSCDSVESLSSYESIGQSSSMEEEEEMLEDRERNVTKTIGKHHISPPSSSSSSSTAGGVPIPSSSSLSYLESEEFFNSLDLFGDMNDDSLFLPSFF